MVLRKRPAEAGRWWPTGAGIAKCPWSPRRGSLIRLGLPTQRWRLTSEKDLRRAMNSRRIGRKKALLKRPIGGSGSI